jgi:hypothetical protein
MTPPTTGTALGVRDCGVPVLLFLVPDEGQTVPTHLDRCSFGWLLGGEGCGIGELVGRRVRHGGGHIVFLDREGPT